MPPHRRWHSRHANRFRSDAHADQLVDVAGVDLERPHIPGAVGVAQGFAWLSPFRSQNADQCSQREAVFVRGIDNTLPKQRTCLWQGHFYPFSRKGHARHQESRQEKAQNHAAEPSEGGKGHHCSLFLTEITMSVPLP